MRVHHLQYFDPTSSEMATACGETSGGGKEATVDDGTAPKVADFDELVDEILAKKGPAKYTGGLSEDNWEEVG